MLNTVKFRFIVLLAFLIAQACTQTGKTSYPDRLAYLTACSLEGWGSSDLRFVAAHLASLEWNVDELAKRLDSTDNGVNSKSDFAQENKRFHEIRQSDWKFFVSNEEMNVPHFAKSFKGLKLPKEVVNKIYRENAQKWFPGI